MSEKKRVTPLGVDFRFVVKPSLDENHKKGLKYFIIMKSGLNQHFKNIDVEYYDGYFIDKESGSISTNDDKLLESKQMVIRVWCPEPIVVIYEKDEESFYKQIEDKFSRWIIELIQSNVERKYESTLVWFGLVARFKVK